MRHSTFPCILIFFVYASLFAQVDVAIDSSVINLFGQMQIDISSSPDSYYILCCRHSLPDGPEWPVVMARGVEGKLTLTDPLKALSVNHYRVEKYSIRTPGDYDRDGIDDLTEFDDLSHQSPFNAAIAIDSGYGSVALADEAVFDAFSYHNMVIFPFASSLQGLKQVKFLILRSKSNNPIVYFMNTKAYESHAVFINELSRSDEPNSISGETDEMIKGEISYHPNVIAPSGTAGLYHFKFHTVESYSFEKIQMAYELLSRNMAFLCNNFSYYPLFVSGLPDYRDEKERYDASRMTVFLEDQLYKNTMFMPLNTAEGYGLLRIMPLDQNPGPRDIVIYNVLPNELSRVGGIITTVPQTPLSHVNLRAMQDNIPNAYIRNAVKIDSISPLIGRYVYYRVNAEGYMLREATMAETDAHYASVRPAHAQKPVRDLSIHKITPLDSISFEQWSSFGVKTANVATMRTFGFPEGTIPDGFGVPFYFYDEFMKFNGLYDTIQGFMMLDKFKNEYSVQDSILGDFRKTIKKAKMPEWMRNALTIMQQSFPASTSIRCRSSTNNEDLPGFSGAGLYDSKTQHPDEGHIEKSIKQVYASLWNLRSFTEREFYRIDHFHTAMGVLIHPNFTGEKANGVAVTTDPRYGTTKTFYLNTQIGEDLVTNPDSFSIPEELLLSSAEGNVYYAVVQQSNLMDYGTRILPDGNLRDLRNSLLKIHERFKNLYQAQNDSAFAMEIEYKITSNGKLTIKQARPWVNYWGDIPIPIQPEQKRTRTGHVLQVSCRGNFKTVASIVVTLRKKQPLTATLLDCLGRQIAKFTSGYLPAGSHVLHWKAARHPDGVYLLKVATPDAMSTLKINKISD